MLVERSEKTSGWNFPAIRMTWAFDKKIGCAEHACTLRLCLVPQEKLGECCCSFKRCSEIFLALHH